MGEAKRKTYTAAFKAKVGLEAIRGVETGPRSLLDCGAADPGGSLRPPPQVGP